MEYGEVKAIFVTRQWTEIPSGVHSETEPQDDDAGEPSEMLQGLRTLFFVWQVFVILCILDREGVKRANSEQKLPVTERNRRVSSLSVRLLVFISSNGMKMVQQKMETD